MRSLAVGASKSDWSRSLLLAVLLGPFMAGRVVVSFRGAGSAKARMLSWALMMIVENSMFGTLGECWNFVVVGCGIECLFLRKGMGLRSWMASEAGLIRDECMNCLVRIYTLK